MLYYLFTRVQNRARKRINKVLFRASIHCFYSGFVTAGTIFLETEKEILII